VNADRNSGSVHGAGRKCAIGFDPLEIGVAVVGFLIEIRDSERRRELRRVMKLTARVTQLNRGFWVERLPIVDQGISSSGGRKKLSLKLLDEPIPRIKNAEKSSPFFPDFKAVLVGLTPEIARL
jgi:hypothetical protein